MLLRNRQAETLVLKTYNKLFHLLMTLTVSTLISAGAVQKQ